MVESRVIRVSNTVEFFPKETRNPLLNEEQQIGLLLDDLVTVLSRPARTIPSIRYGSELNDAVRTMQRLMCKDDKGKQKFSGINHEEQRVPPAERGPRTRSQAINEFQIGTIIRKQYGDGKWYEGEISKYDATNKFYTVKYKDGDIAEYTHEEIKRYKKDKQVYSKVF